MPSFKEPLLPQPRTVLTSVPSRNGNETPAVASKQMGLTLSIVKYEFDIEIPVWYLTSYI